jgi:MFS family permease
MTCVDVIIGTRRAADRLGAHGPLRVLTIGVVLFAAAYAGFAAAGEKLAILAIPFLAAGPAIGCVETAQHSAVAALAPADLRGSAFSLLATTQAIGNFAASVIAYCHVVSPAPGGTAARGFAVTLARSNRARCHMARTLHLDSGP